MIILKDEKNDSSLPFPLGNNWAINLYEKFFGKKVNIIPNKNRQSFLVLSFMRLENGGEI